MAQIDRITIKEKAVSTRELLLPISQKITKMIDLTTRVEERVDKFDDAGLSPDYTPEQWNTFGQNFDNQYQQLLSEFEASEELLPVRIFE